MPAAIERFPPRARRFLAAALLLAGTLAAGSAGAAATAWQAGEGVSTRLVTAVEGTGVLDRISAGLEVRLEPGWKTYWRSPGDAGLPPELDWSGSENLAGATLSYPAPHRFELFGLETFGYSNHVVFPLELAPERTGEPILLRLAARLLVCADICIPHDFTFALDLPAAAPDPDAEAANLIDRFASQVPGDGQAAGLALVEVTGRGEALRIEATAREAFETPDLFVEAGPSDAFSTPSFTLSPDRRHLVAEVERIQAAAAPEPLADRPVTLTLVDGARSVETRLTVADPPAGRYGALPAMLGLALLGGLILNLMPCVLPVLSLKLLSVVGAGGRTARDIRRGFLVTAAGAVAAFLVLAGLAIALRAAGIAVGWGMQFQEPLFVVFMVVLLTLFACNLAGLFEISLPGRVADAAARVGAAAPGRRDGMAGQFATGAFAALLATPCSAPFLGTAVGFALTGGPGETVLVFAALGLGLALPYLAVAAVPRLAQSLPRPGRWTARLKAALSIALAATALWLLTVLAVQQSTEAAVAVGGLMALLALLLWARRLGGTVRRAGVALSVALAATAFLVPALFGSSDAAPGAPAAATKWTAFDRGAIPRLVAEGRTVFVDVTADWCLTCKANEFLVLDRDEVSAALAQDAVVPMLADWTSPDPAIADYLAAHGRYGIPFYAVYGPEAPEGIILPELLTAAAVLDAIAEAGVKP